MRLSWTFKFSFGRYLNGKLNQNSIFLEKLKIESQIQFLLCALIESWIVHSILIFDEMQWWICFKIVFFNSQYGGNKHTCTSNNFNFQFFGRAQKWSHCMTNFQFICERIKNWTSDYWIHFWKLKIECWIQCLKMSGGIENWKLNAKLTI